MRKEIEDILKENQKRQERNSSPFNPVTGEGSVGKRVKVAIDGFAIPVQWLPESMMNIKFVRMLAQAGSIDGFLLDYLKVQPDPDSRLKVAKKFLRLRYRHDFPFWAATLVYIKNKGGGEDVLFRLTRPQRRFVAMLEEKRLANRPIRLILLKARQWGGSTTSQLYIAWLQLVHCTGLNSLIIAHVRDTSIEIKDMFDRMMKYYPLELLYDLGEAYSPKAPKIEGVGGSQNIHRIPPRNCKIKIGTAEKPDSCRGGDYNLVHLSEVGLWQKTEGKSPEDIVQSACSGILLQPYTMIVYESTANGTGNFFQREYDAAKKGESQFDPLFISWFDIDQYSLPFADETQRRGFAAWLWVNRNDDSVPSARAENGKYLWWLWSLGATLEAINWYIQERKGKNDHGVMASEYPSDDVEAFVHSGSMVFDKYLVEKLRPACRPPRYKGEIYGQSDSGDDALSNLRFTADAQGCLSVWALPQPDTPEEEITDRYLAVVDVGGRSNKADWSVITVFDRLDMLEAQGTPVVVAQWRGHCDIDLLAWRAAQVAAFYNNALLVIESNTLETHDKERQVEGGDQSLYILNQIKDIYPNLYARRQSEEDIRQGLPRKYGFHTNTKTKPLVISGLIKAVRDGLWTERDIDCIDELLTYERKPNGAYGAIIGKHDDLLMTRAIGLHICFNEMELPRIVDRSRRFSRKRNGPVSEAVF
jgi:hypothetical protein